MRLASYEDAPTTNRQGGTGAVSPTLPKDERFTHLGEIEGMLGNRLTRLGCLAERMERLADRLYGSAQTVAASGLVDGDTTPAATVLDRITYLCSRFAWALERAETELERLENLA